ncbi:hypothetical protein EDB80DRAFT_693342 [Ilyonectria destructans]|nr:hypothetical protein EDB80DRAFT_693342 [Ilyonectria destructans]
MVGCVTHPDDTRRQTKGPARALAGVVGSCIRQVLGAYKSASVRHLHAEAFISLLDLWLNARVAHFRPATRSDTTSFEPPGETEPAPLQEPLRRTSLYRTGTQTQSDTLESDGQTDDIQNRNSSSRRTQGGRALQNALLIKEAL